MGKTTISVEGNTHSRFISNLGSYQATQGRSIEADEFVNELLDVYEKVQQVAAQVAAQAETGGLQQNG